jgi:inner membrane transporter RhtA
VSGDVLVEPRAPVTQGDPGPFGRAVAAVPPPGLLIISIVSIQLGAAVAVNLFPVLGPVATVFLRLGFSAVLLLVATRRTLDRRAGRHWTALLLFGVVLGLMNLSFYGAISRIPLGIAVAIEFVGPLGVAIATSRRPLDFAWIALAALGILLLTPNLGSTLDPLGVALALSAGACWAGFILLTRHVGKTLPGNSGLAIGMTVGALVTLPVMLGTGGLPAFEPWVLAASLAVALLSTALPLSLEFEALKRMPARTYGILVTLEPVVATGVGAVLLGQAIGIQGFVAVVCVTAAALGVTISDRGKTTRGSLLQE